MNRILAKIVAAFSRNGNGNGRGHVDEKDDEQATEQVTRKNVDHQTDKLKLSLIKARAELENVGVKMSQARADCPEQ